MDCAINEWLPPCKSRWGDYQENINHLLRSRGTNFFVWSQCYGILVSRIPDSWMISSNVTRLNIPVTHLMRSWMKKTGIIGYWSRDPLLVSNKITNIYKIIKWRRIITNAVLPSGWVIAAIWTIFSSKSIVIESRYMRNNNNMSGPIPPSNNSFIR